LDHDQELHASGGAFLRHSQMIEVVSLKEVTDPQAAVFLSSFSCDETLFSQEEHLKPFKVEDLMHSVFGDL
jgi:hypothetical protein